MKIINVTDRRNFWIGEWETEPLIYKRLTEIDLDRKVIYVGKHWLDKEVGTINSFRDGIVWVRFHSGSTAAACNPRDLVFGIKPLDGDLTR